MRKWVRTSAKAALLTAGFVALGAGVSFADSGPVVTSGNGSIGGGNQLVGDLNVPVNASGNAIALVGSNAGASSEDTGAVVHEHGDGPVVSSGNGSILGGNQAVIDGDVPVNVSGNAVSGVLSNAGAATEDTGSAVVEHSSWGHGDDVQATSGNGSVLGGNQGDVDLDVPVNVSGNAIGAVAGVAGAATEDTGAAVLEDGHHHGHHHGGHHKEHDKGGDGYDRAHQAAPVGGGLIDRLSDAAEPVHAQTGAVDAGPVLHQSAGGHGGHGGDLLLTSGNGSIVGGNQLDVDGDVPVNVSGNAIAAVGSLAGASSEDTGAVVSGDDDETAITSGNGSVLGGNQGDVDADVPVNVSGNAVSAVLGNAGAASEDTGALVDHEDGGDRGSGREHSSNEAVLPEPADTLPLTGELPEVPAVPGTEALPLSAEAPAVEAPAELSGMPQSGTAVDGVTDAVGLGL